MALPAGYTVAITRVPLHSVAGLYVRGRRKGERKGLTGGVMLNVTDGVLTSATVYPRKGKAVNVKADRISGLFLSCERDRLTFAALTR